jgi:hypothetical protein
VVGGGVKGFDIVKGFDMVGKGGGFTRAPTVMPATIEGMEPVRMKPVRPPPAVRRARARAVVGGSWFGGGRGLEWVVRGGGVGVLGKENGREGGGGGDRPFLGGLNSLFCFLFVRG